MHCICGVGCVYGSALVAKGQSVLQCEVVHCIGKVGWVNGSALVAKGQTV